MKEIQTEKEYLQKVHELIEHDRHYYDERKPVISDYEYDQLIFAVKNFEEFHPDLMVPESPTQRVSEALEEGFQKGEHISPMLSLSNTYSKEEVGDFITRVKKLLNTEDIELCAELKIDGTAISILYEKGKFTKALTRGNGKIGDDVTANVKTIRHLPLNLPGRNFPDQMEFRGEVFMHKTIFEKINREREEMGLVLWANPRNAAAGSLKLLDSKEVAKRKLDLILYGMIADPMPVTTQLDIHQFLKKHHLPIAKNEYIQKCKEIKDVMSFVDKILKIRNKLTYEIDGIVLKVNQLKDHSRLGVTGKSPRYAVAYKFAPEQAQTQIKQITVQVGRTGILTPVAELEPVQLAGSRISRATLHNQDEIDRKDIRITDTVMIEKGGDVIPKVVFVLKDKRSAKALRWKMPKHCPVCQTSVIKKENEVAYRCPNIMCSGQNLQRLIHFASKSSLDIGHLGKKVMEQLIEKGLVSTLSDLYLLDETKLLKLEGFKEKSIHNLLKSIEKSKRCSLDRLIMGLGIPHVGKETAYLIAKQVGTFEGLTKLTKEDFVKIEGIGDVVAESIVSFLQDPKQKKEMELLLKYGMNPIPIKKVLKNHAFSDKTFVLTGTLKEFSRDEAKTLIKDRGGKTSSAVSAKTDFLLIGESPGSKLQKAKKLGMTILTEDEFKRML